MAVKINIPKDNNIITIPIEEAMPDNYLPYAVEVAKDRALPDVRDGLKPVQRRILYGAYLLKAMPDKPYYKSARIVGDILGKFHPHGDSSVYDAMVILAQGFTTRVPMIDGHGNWGSQDGDSAAAMRYTEARLTEPALMMLKDIDKDVVNMVNNYSDTEKEPEVLPGRFPNLLVNGTFGIAVGLATNIPPHNLSEVIDGTLAYIDNKEISTKELMKYIKGPDLPTGAYLIGKNSLESAYETGEGKVTIRAKADIEKSLGGKLSIVISEFPFRKSKSRLLETISEMTADKKHSKVLESIVDIRDESDREGIRAVIELKKSAGEEEAERILRYLYKKTDLQCNLSFNMVALHDGKPETMGLKKILTYYVDYQKEVIKRRTTYDLNKAKDRFHIVEGFIKAIKIMDEVIKTIRSSKSKQNAKDNLVEKYDFSPRQAEAILELMLYKLTGLEIESYEKEYNELNKLIIRLEKILSSEKELLKIIKKELLEIKEKYGDERRTVIIEDDEEAKIDTEDFIIDEDVVVTISNEGFFKRVPLKSYNRSSMDVTEIEYREGDFNRFLLSSNTKDSLILFTDTGNMYQIKVNLITEGKWKEKGERIEEYIKALDLSKEKIISAFAINDFTSQKDIMFITSKGGIKKSFLHSYSTSYTKLSALRLKEDEFVVNAFILDREREKGFIYLKTKNGFSFSIEEPEVEALERNLSSQNLIFICESDEIIEASLKEDFDFKSFFVSLNEKNDLIISSREDYKFKVRTMTNSSCNLRIITDKGRIFNIKSVMLQNIKKPVELNSIIDIKEDERAISIISSLDGCEYEKIYFFTKKGMVKAVDYKELNGLNGANVIKFKYEDDALVSVMYKPYNENFHIIAVTKKAMCIRFSIDSVSCLGVNAMGVTGISLKEDDEVVFADFISVPLDETKEISLDAEDSKELILKSFHENVKKVKVTGIKAQNRAGRGVNIMLIVLDDYVLEIKML